MDRRAIQFSLAALLAPVLAGVALMFTLDDRSLDAGVGLLFGLLTASLTCALLVPGLAVAHLRGWVASAPAALGLAVLLLPVALSSLLFPAIMAIPALGIAYAFVVWTVPGTALRAAATEAFPASAELRSVRAAWVYLPGAIRLALQVAGATVLVLGSAATAGLFASGMLSLVAAPGTAGASALVTLAAGVGLVAVVGVMVMVGVPPLILVSPFGGITRGRAQRWVSARAGIASGRLSCGAHLALAGLGLLAALLGITALVMSIAGIGVASIGAVSAMPVWLGLAAVLGVRSHLAELLVHAGAPGLIRRNPGELLLASLFQLLALTWLVGVGAFLGTVAGWLTLHQMVRGPNGAGQLVTPALGGAWVALAIAAGLQGWVTVRSLVTLALLRVMFVRRLVDAERPAATVDPDPPADRATDSA